MILAFIALIFVGNAHAGDIEWKGTYRFEGVSVQNPELADSNEETAAYMLQHLVLMPKITAYDGLTIHGRFDILNADSTAYPEYANSQIGDFVGGGVGSSAVTPTNSGNSNTLAENQRSSFIQVNELYMNYSHEFGLLTVGRAPVHFGLGISYNNGHGEFDHWFDNRDLISYKFVTGNLSVSPTIAKLSEGDLNTADDVDDYMLELAYSNPETDLTIGILYRRRHAASSGNDVPAGVFAAPDSSFKGEYWNFFFSRYITETIHIGLEGGIQKGEAGAGGIELDGFGVALELEYKPMDSSFAYDLKVGAASGDDPATANSYEGFVFDRNYDVAMLLFNRPMGQADFFRTGYINNPSGTQTNTAASSLADVEAISNVLYIAPTVHYKWSDKWHSQIGLTYATLSEDPLNMGVDKAVGFEVDLGVDYRPYEGVRWLNRVGIFMPGSAFEGGTNNFATETIFGIETKAAITF